MSEDETIFIQAVRAAEWLPPAVRDHAATVRSCERRAFDPSYLAFLREQIALGARGPEWTAILKQRLSALSPFCGLPTISGIISTVDGVYNIRVDPNSGRIIYHELHEPIGND